MFGKDPYIKDVQKVGMGRVLRGREGFEREGRVLRKSDFLSFMSYFSVKLGANYEKKYI